MSDPREIVHAAGPESPSATPPTSAKVSPPPTARPLNHAKISRRKQVVGTIITLAVLVIVFVGILPQFASYGEAWDAITAMTAGWIVALIAACLINLFVYVWPFLVAIPGLRYGPGFMVRQTSYAISNGIPAVGGAIGLGVQFSMLGSYGIGSAPAAAGIAINSLWNLVATLGIPVLAVLALLITGQTSSEYILAAILGLVAIAIGAVVLALVLRSETNARKIGGLADGIVARVLRLVHRPRELHLGDALAQFRGSTVDVIRGRWALLTVSNIAMQLTSFAILFVALRAVQAGEPNPTTFAETFTAFAVGRLASFIPVTPGGLGTVDAAITGILTGFGAQGSDALAADLVWRAATYVPQILIGVITFVVWRRRQTHRQSPAPATLADAPTV
jgi:uncharacterized protein (TIRG00374 family)